MKQVRGFLPPLSPNELLIGHRFSPFSLAFIESGFLDTYFCSWMERVTEIEELWLSASCQQNLALNELLTVTYFCRVWYLLQNILKPQGQSPAGNSLFQEHLASWPGLAHRTSQPGVQAWVFQSWVKITQGYCEIWCQVWKL